MAVAFESMLGVLLWYVRKSIYIDPRERTWLDIEFGCPYGGDDSGQVTGELE